MEATPDREVLRAGALEVRPQEYVVRAGGRVVAVSLRELELLVALARRPGRVVPRAELYATVWGTPLREDDRSVDVYVHKLRLKLAAALPDWSFIHTHFGFGYRFEPEPVEDVDTSASNRNDPRARPVPSPPSEPRSHGGWDR